MAYVVVPIDFFQKDPRMRKPNWLAREFANHKKLPLRFYMDAGTNELDIRGDGSGILVANRQLRDVLRAKGYEVLYQEFPGYHDYINWRGTLADGLIWLFGDSSKLAPVSSERGDATERRYLP